MCRTPWPARRSTTRARSPASSRRSASPTSARPSSAGTRRPASRCTARWSGRTAAPPARCDELREAGEEDRIRERTGPGARPVLLGHQDRVAPAQRRRARAAGSRGARGVRDDRLVAAVQADRRARHRPDQRLADAALRHPREPLGPGAARPLRSTRALAARGPAELWRARPGEGLPGTCPSPAWRATSRRRCSASAASSPASARTRTAPARSCSSTRAPRVPPPRRGPALHRRVADRAPDHVRARGGDLRHRRGRAMAARRAADHRAGGRDRGAGRARWTPTTASTSCPP